MPHAGLKRGGAHNRADKISWQLDEHGCRKVFDRSFDAWEAGFPLNRFITLAWGLAGVDATDAVWITGQFINRAREWMRSHGYPVMPWCWTQECGDTFGQHAHILLHVPPELDLLFRTMPRQWAKGLIGGRYITGTVDTKRLPCAGPFGGALSQYEAALLGRLHYMLKCAPEPLEEALGLIDWRYKDWDQSSRVIGKRTGVWQRRGGDLK